MDRVYHILVVFLWYLKVCSFPFIIFSKLKNLYFLCVLIYNIYAMVRLCINKQFILINRDAMLRQYNLSTFDWNTFEVMFNRVVLFIISSKECMLTFLYLFPNQKNSRISKLNYSDYSLQLRNWIIYDTCKRFTLTSRIHWSLRLLFCSLFYFDK